MEHIILIVHVLLAISLVGLVLMQHGKGADMGAAFGSGASASVFGSAGSGSFLTRATAIIATLFFCTSMGLAFLSGQKPEQSSVMDQLAPPVEEVAPEIDSSPVPDFPADVPNAGSSEVPELLE